MKKFWPRNKALFYKEYRSARWICVLMVMTLILFKIMPILSDMDRTRYALQKGDKVWNPNGWFGEALVRSGSIYVPLFFGIIMLLCILLFSSERKSNSCGLIASMPFKREDTILVKLITGFLTIILSFLIVFIIMSITFFCNRDVVKESYNLIPQWFLINTLFSIAVFTVIFFVETLMGNTIIASIVGIIVPAVPMGLVSLVESLIEDNFKLENSYYSWMEKLNFYNISSVDSKCHEEIYKFYYVNFSGKIIFLIIFSAIVSIMAYYAYKNNKFERNGQLFIFKSLNSVFKWGVTICFGLSLGRILGESFYLRSQRVLIVDLLTLIGLIVGYFMMNKVIKVFSK